MKLPLTEKFLWDIFNVSEGISEFLEDSKPSLNKAFYPEYEEVRKLYKKKRRTREFSRFVSYLKKNGFIRIKELENKEAIILTPKGFKKLVRIKYKINRKRRRDGRCQMILFDIPEKRNRDRDLFRSMIKTLGYQRFQKSIWISPYDITKETQKIIRELNLIPYVRLLLVKELEL